jgi:CheY-like chemotaxis protein
MPGARRRVHGRKTGKSAGGHGQKTLRKYVTPPSNGRDLLANVRGDIRVLVVDDVRANRALTARLVTKCLGLRCDSASSGAACLAMLRRAALGMEQQDDMTKQLKARKLKARKLKKKKGSDGTAQAARDLPLPDPYKLVLMDNQMPGMDGLQCSETIRGDVLLRDIKIIGVTGNSMQEDTEKFLGSGADKVLIKPLILANLVEAIVELMPTVDKADLVRDTSHKRTHEHGTKSRAKLLMDPPKKRKLVKSHLRARGN